MPRMMEKTTRGIGVRSATADVMGAHSVHGVELTTRASSGRPLGGATGGGSSMGKRPGNVAEAEWSIAKETRQRHKLFEFPCARTEGGVDSTVCKL